MKLDQETVVKHQFWFLLGGYLLIWLVVVMYLKFTVPGEIATLKDNYEKAGGGVKSAPRISPAFLPPWEKAAKEIGDFKGVIWKKAWDFQSFIYDWPPAWVNKDMTNPETPLSSDELNDYSHKWYPEQIERLRAAAPRFLDPVELKGGFDSVFKPITKNDWKETPTREEVWLAQEDYWVKRQLLYEVYYTMLLLARMQSVPIDEKEEPAPEGVQARYRFRNQNWEITLNLRKNDKGYLVIGGDSTIKNVHSSHHPQPLTSAKGKGIWFNVAQDNVRTRFEVRGEPVGYNEVRYFSMEKEQERSDYKPLAGINWDPKRLKEHPIAVSQGFDSSNSPIRRIDAIEVRKQDCRTYYWALKANQALAKLDASPEDEKKLEATSSAPSEAAGGPAGMMKMDPSMMKKMSGGLGGKDNTPEVVNPTPNNGLERNRYLLPPSEGPASDQGQKPPSRHLPLALQLVVEQSHINDVLLSLANSPLRFQITQAEFRHLKDYVPQGDGDKKEGTDMAGVFMGGMPGMPAGMGSMSGMSSGPSPRQMQEQMQMQRRMQQQMQMAGGGPMGGGAKTTMTPGMAANQGPVTAYDAPGTRTTGATTAGGQETKLTKQNQQDDNLVQLTIYGIATLYRRPDAPKPEEQANQPGGVVPQAAPLGGGKP